MSLMTATVREGASAEAAELVLPKGDLDRLGLATGAIVTLDVQAAMALDDEAVLRAALEALDRGEGTELSDSDLAAMRQEVAALAARGERGGSAPTLERLMRQRASGTSTRSD